MSLTVSFLLSPFSGSFPLCPDSRLLLFHMYTHLGSTWGRREHVQYLSFWVWLMSLKMTSSGAHVPVYTISFLFMTVCGPWIFCILHLSTGTWAFPKAWLLWTVFQKAWMCRRLCSLLALDTSRYVTRGGTAGSYGNSISFRVLDFHSDFHKGCTNLDTDQHCGSALPGCPHPHQNCFSLINF